MVRQHAPLWVVLGCLAAFVITLEAPVKYTSADSRFSLLTSLAILEGKGVRLDGYVYPEAVAGFYQLRQDRGHLYNYNAIGTSIVALPFVALANLRGDSVRYEDVDRGLQTIIAALCVTASFLLGYLVSRAALDVGFSLLVASAFTFGTQIASTMGSALWNHDVEVVCLFGALLLVLRTTSWRGWRRAAGLGLLLFTAYLCRPTALVATLAMLAMVFARDRRAACIAGGTFVVGLLLFMRFSWREFHTVLPYYYAGGRLGAEHFWRGLYGNLFSPARGAIIYSPFLALTAAGAVWCAPALRRDSRFWLATGWALALLILVSDSSSQWWGGFSFGSRLLTDATPALLWISALTIAAILDRHGAATARRFGTAFAALAVVAALINTYQGLYNGSTVKWNESPNIDQNPQYLFDWKRPQFLANPDMLDARERAHSAGK